MQSASAEEQFKSEPGTDRKALARAAAKEPFLKLLRELVQTYQACLAYDEEHIRQLGLTIPQYDVIATLGNTSGMTMNVLAEKTLVTKGTLTGIIDRLEKKGLVRREVPPEDRRCFIIVLTAEGERLFEEVFPKHTDYLKQRFDRLSSNEMQEMITSLRRLREIF